MSSCVIYFSVLSNIEFASYYDDNRTHVTESTAIEVIEG